MTGKVVKTIEIGDQPYTLVAKFGTMVAAEREIGMPIPKLADNMGFDAISALFWAFLQPKHRMTRDASNNLVDDFGIEKTGELVASMLTDYFGGSEEAQVDEGKPGKAAPKKELPTD